jgi:YbbR domain-containing protein
VKAPWPFQHLGLKLLSVAFAVLLWLAVAGDQTVERGLRVPLQLEQFPEGLELQSSPPSLVDVRVRGASGALARIDVSGVVVALDLHAAKPGRRLFQLSPDQVRAPFDVEVVAVTPATLALAFERTLSRRVPVVPAIEGTPAQGFESGEVQVNPPTVEVEGPESAVTRVTQVSTDAVSLTGAKATVNETVGLGISEPSVRLKVAAPVVISVRIVPVGAPRGNRSPKAEN